MAKIKNIFKLLNLPFAIVLLVVSVITGWLISFTKADTKDLISQKESLEYKRGHLEFLHDFYKLQKTNDLYFDKYHLSVARKDINRIGLVDVANDTRHKCEEGTENGCWKKETDIYNGDTLAVEIHYHNRSPVTVKNVTLNLSVKKLSHSALFEAKAKSNGIVIQRGIAKAYLHNCNFLELLIGQGSWKIVDSLGYKHIDDYQIVANNSDISIGDLKGNGQGAIILRLKAGIEK
ncbi:hypothetical protein [Mucilaginibacter ginsenosidivorax]|uniref:Uncharacterized protein n=1 Tax=Mucilaginibacter ginsenosidivorax TaxID=862126 RepID=A0A5B8W0F2_9SPHI|nr:hypothetical protein [Mucilaginibacter ginsenosidivorax]QEC77387.1 hypothetical protein FSB76_16055 [Mucilaginibacter ginsenosidivorax]